jgi:hypothetical protein
VTLCHTGTSLDGQTVSSILGTMNTALGGGATRPATRSPASTPWRTT